MLIWYEKLNYFKDKMTNIIGLTVTKNDICHKKNTSNVQGNTKKNYRKGY